MAGCNHCPTDTNVVDPIFRRVLWVALWVNAAMFIVEVSASYYSQSVALQADALDFFGDAVNYAISLFVLGMALHLRARAALLKGLSMGLFGVFVLINATYRAFNGDIPDANTMGSVAIFALLANVFVAILLFKFRSGDANMRSIWLCSRNDAIGNIAVLFAALGVFASDTHWPDLFVAVIMAALSISAAINVIRLAHKEMQTERPHSS